MSSPLVVRTASVCRSVFSKPAVFSGIRFSSSQTKDVQHLEKQPVLSVENLSGAPAVTMKFFTKEDAINFAEKQGWQYYVQEPKQSKFVKKAYGDNYLYSPGKLRMIKTK
ncbi:hypothetical protein BD408DRAFT_408104 [Parasitella parasitica]|nr:hypothetical protein BD408DRAFT_408104 [Parasitella parasitica]